MNLVAHSHLRQMGAFRGAAKVGPFRRQDKRYSRSITVPTRRPTADSAVLVGTAVGGSRSIFKPGFNYAKAGVMLLDLEGPEVNQAELDLDEPGADRAPLMGAVNALNDRYGRSTVGLASAGLAGTKRRFEMKRERGRPSTPLVGQICRPRGRSCPPHRTRDKPVYSVAEGS